MQINKSKYVEIFADAIIFSESKFNNFFVAGLNYFQMQLFFPEIRVLCHFHTKYFSGNYTEIWLILNYSLRPLRNLLGGGGHATTYCSQASTRRDIAYQTIIELRMKKSTKARASSFLLWSS